MKEASRKTLVMSSGSLGFGTVMDNIGVRVRSWEQSAVLSLFCFFLLSIALACKSVVGGA